MKFNFYQLCLLFKSQNMPATKQKKSIPERFREVLEDRGVKQAWLASKTGISPEHISNILADRVLLTEENKAKINEALGTDIV